MMRACTRSRIVSSYGSTVRPASDNIVAKHSLNIFVCCSAATTSLSLSISAVLCDCCSSSSRLIADHALWLASRRSLSESISQSSCFCLATASSLSYRHTPVNQLSIIPLVFRHTPLNQPSIIPIVFRHTPLNQLSIIPLVIALMSIVQFRFKCWVYSRMLCLLHVSTKAKYHSWSWFKHSELRWLMWSITHQPALSTRSLATFPATPSSPSLAQYQVILLGDKCE